MGFVSQKRILKKRTDRSAAGNRSVLEGVIIYVDSDLAWCNVKIDEDTILYRIQFAETINPRYKRVQQSVLLSQAVDKRYKYVITSPSRRKIAISDFDDKGDLSWADNSGDSGDASVWADTTESWTWA